MQRISDKKRIYIILIIASVILYFFEYSMISESTELTKFHELQLLLIYGIVQGVSIKKFGMFNIFSLILVGFFIFAVGGILHFVLSGDNIQELEGVGYGNFYFTNVQIQRSLLIYSLFIALAFFSYNIFHKDEYSFVGYLSKTQKDYVCFKIGKYLMWIFLFVEIYKGYLFFSSFSIDRVLIYLYGNVENPVPTWVRFLATFFEMGYAFVLCSKPTKNEFKNYSALYFVVLIPEILVGNRGMLGGFILFYLWYYARFYNPKPIRMKTAAILGVVMLFVFQLMQFYRDGLDIRNTSFSMTTFLKGQAISFYILPLYIQNIGSIQYYNYPFVLYNVIGGFSGYTGQSIEVLQHNCGVGHQLMYTINPDYYLAGASFGSNSIVELYDLGILGVIIGALFFPIMISFLERQFVKRRFALFMSYFLLTNFILSARSSYFPSFYAIVKYYIFYIFILLLYNLVNGKAKTSNAGR